MKKSKNKSLLPEGNGKRESVMKPQLTSLIDVMTILLIFLLKSFSVEGDLISASTQLELPNSESRDKPAPAINIEVTPVWINLDGSNIIKIEDFKDGEKLLILELFYPLKEKRGQLTGALKKRVLIQCDKGTDFKVLKKVMFTCAKADLSEFSLLVNQKGRS